jgi:hypothetical protein
MGHCAYSELADLESVLAVVRSWEAVREKSPGVFYVKSTAFLHFHSDRSGARWADARCGTSWGPRLPVPSPSTPGSRRRLLADLCRYHARTLAALVPAPGRVRASAGSRR